MESSGIKILTSGMVALASLCCIVCAENVHAEEITTPIPENILTIDELEEQNVVTLEEEPEVTFEGTMTDQDTEFSYTYTAPRDGLYRFDVTDVKANCSVRLYINDSLGNDLVGLYGGITVGDTLTLEENETYSLTVKKGDGNTDFTIRIMPQKPSVDLTDVSIVNDQITFEDETTTYYFTAPRTGTYQFSIQDKTRAASFSARIWSPYKDQYDTVISEQVYGGFDTMTVQLDEGITYLLKIWQYEGVGNYTMKVWYQKPDADITGYTSVSDEMEYGDQINYYDFTALADGTYSFATDGSVDLYLELLQGDEKIADTAYENPDVITYEMSGGAEYRIAVYERALGNYKLDIGYPAEAAAILTADGAEFFQKTSETDEQEKSDSSDQIPETSSSESQDEPSESDAPVDSGDSERLNQLEERVAALEKAVDELKGSSDL